MGFWEGKCFMCYVVATITAIVALSVNTTVKESKKVEQIDTVRYEYGNTN